MTMTFSASPTVSTKASGSALAPAEGGHGWLAILQLFNRAVDVESVCHEKRLHEKRHHETRRMSDGVHDINEGCSNDTTRQVFAEAQKKRWLMDLGQFLYHYLTERAQTQMAETTCSLTFILNQYLQLNRCSAQRPGVQLRYHIHHSLLFSPHAHINP